MLVRIRSKDGNFRFEFQPSASISDLAAKILGTTVDADPTTLKISDQPRGNETPLSALEGHTLQSLGLKHGDLIFVSYQPRAVPSSPTHPADPPIGISNADPSKRPWEHVQEASVDQYWRAQDGKIPRRRDTHFCKHGANAMCDHCMPLEPYDSGYHSEHNIKHLSYHAYIRKLTPNASSNSSSTADLPPLNPPSYKVKIPCPTGGHPNWPAGICTACQPSAITLQSQPFRMVDHLEIASSEIIERFLQAWRRSGVQRFGWLIGHYKPYPEVPMGVKAVVEAIYEPPQQGDEDGLVLGPWEDEQRIKEFAKLTSIPLTIVGYIFTDLTPTEDDRTKSLYKRHSQSFYLSSLEAIFAARVQNANLTPSRSSPTGEFSSRMVTAVLTGVEDGGIDIAAYQVSEQACAMVAADMIEASVDPGIVRVKEEDRNKESARYVPDVFFRYKNEYGLEVKKSAKPSFPVEYLLVTVSHGFPQTPSPLFRSTKFSIENRPGYENQDVEAVIRELARLRAPAIVESSFGIDKQLRAEVIAYLSDWHLVAFLEASNLLSRDDIKALLLLASSPNTEDPGPLDALIRTPGWETLMTFAREISPPAPPAASAPTSASRPSHLGMDEDIPQEIFDQIAREEEASRSAGPASAGNTRICPHCTFENTDGGSDCEVCGLPL